ncbi:hypothetical protein MBLNU457_5354t1 [Dothideomycetes sp. NU457]
MQIKSLALVFAASSMAMAQSADPNLISIYQVLATALPSSLVAEALTNSAAVSSEIASEFRAGATPSWFAALPTDIQTYLNPPVPTNVSGAGSSAAALQTSHFSSLISNATPIANVTMTSAAGAGITPVANASAIGHNTTGLAGLQSSLRSMNSSLSAAASSNTAGGAAGSSGRATTTAASGSGSAAGAGAGASGGSATASRSSSAGAAVHTAVGFGVAGVAGIVGLLAL